MLTGEIRSQIDSIWGDFWSGGVSNPLSVIEQLTYLLFIKRLDELHTVEEKKAAQLKIPMERRIFPEGQSGEGKNARPFEDLRWSRFKSFEPREMFKVVDEHVFPFLRAMGGEGSAFGEHMKDARLGIPTPALLAKAVEKLDAVKMDDRDTKGDVYEYMLGKIASAGQNGQFRTPRHIIALMVALTRPTPTDIICDPASGTCGFLVAAAEYLRHHHSELMRDAKLRKHFHEGMFNGFDFDSTMLRIGAMNMMLHGVEKANIIYRDSLAEEHSGDDEKYSLILANPPFSGSLDYEATAKDLQNVVKTKKTELLFVALFLRLLKTGGRAAVIVPSGVLESDSSAHAKIRRALVMDNGLEAVISLPHWVFKPYASVSTSILIFTKNSRTDQVLFYKIENDGFNDDAAKTPREGSELSDVINVWQQRHLPNYHPVRRKHRLVSRTMIVENEFDLSPSFYLSGYEYPQNVDLVPLGTLFDINKGSLSAASANGGDYPFFTSSEEPRRHDTWTNEGEAICIPIVSATGHGHAAIKTIHYAIGRYAVSTITAILTPKPDTQISVSFVYFFLLTHKDELLVPLMRGAANVSLNLDRLKNLRIPVPRDNQKQVTILNDLVSAQRNIDDACQALRVAEIEYSTVLERFRNTF